MNNQNVINTLTILAGRNARLNTDHNAKKSLCTFQLQKNTQCLSQQTDSPNNRLNEPMNYRLNNKLTVKTTVRQTNTDSQTKHHSTDSFTF